MPTADFAACCGICLATPACTVSVQVNSSCTLHHYNQTVSNNTLQPLLGSIVCNPIRPGKGGGAASYPPLPEPVLNSPPPEGQKVTFPSGGRLETGFPKIATTDPRELGFPGVERDGFARVNTEHLCLANNRTFPIPTNDWWVPIIRPLPETTLNYIFPIPYVFDVIPGGVHVSYPFIIATPGSVRNIINRWWTMTAENAPVDGPGHCVSDFDLLTATIVWRSQGGGDGAPARPFMEMPIARGSPYATVRYPPSPPPPLL